jgi:dolichol-phosphate mannosyltransferase
MAEVAVHPTFKGSHGAPRFGIRPFLSRTQRLMRIAGGAVSMRTAMRFAAVTAFGVCANYGVSRTLIALSLTVPAAQISSFLCAMVLSYALNSRWTFSDYAARSPEAEWRIFCRFIAISLMAFFLYAGIHQLASETWSWRQATAEFLGISIGAFVGYVGSAFYVFPLLDQRTSRRIRWRIAAVGVAVYAILLRLVFMRTVNLIPEEAYYWNYSQHLDFGYLDHPPMVAWLIWLSTRCLGGSEFALRVSALLMWLITVVFCFRLTQNLYGKTAAFVSVLLLSSLPYYAISGFLIMPDAPLMAAWAGVLFFLERVFFGGSRSAWLGVGLCLGLGLISKYSIVLLGPAILLFMLLDPRSRDWFRQPWPYIGAVLALAIFSPVIVWNADHNWASFIFQSTRRVEEPVRFSLHLLLLSILVILTPIGVISAARVFWPERISSLRQLFLNGDRRWLFASIFTFVPFSVFIAFSLFHGVKLNWTGPIWLALLPAVSALCTAKNHNGVAERSDLQQPWSITIVSSLVICGGAFYFIAIGLPGYPFSSALQLRGLPISWKELGEKASKIEKDISDRSDKDPLLVGMDRYFMASELAYYDGDHDGAKETAGRGLFGSEGLMYSYWFPAAKQNGRDMILFSFEQRQLNSANLATHFQTLGPIHIETITRGGVEVGSFYYRVGHDYRALQAR